MTLSFIINTKYSMTSTEEILKLETVISSVFIHESNDGCRRTV